MNSSNITCSYSMASWEESMDKLYSYFYLLIFIPGLLGNSLALWVLCRFISKKTKAIIFMINLAVADLAHVLSLPLRIYYYFSHDWPFTNAMCMFCFYLKYLNMYAGIVFLVCISIQRCVFLARPFCAKRWKRRYDVRISLLLWVVVGVCCSPFILMRRSAGMGASNNHSCFKDLPMQRPGLHIAIPMMAFAEMCGFVVPLIIIILCSYFITRSLQHSGSGQQSLADRHRALRMVRVCTGVFLFCFAPYHINFLFYMMVQQDLISDCSVRQAVKQFHPISLCLASLNCCLNPLIYYFLTTEFRKLTRQGSSMLRGRLMSWESSSSYKE
ncbi:putative P2Y purinoceptor 10 [Chanos chanos]|uniref:P2Y purinoceptor 10 n=1 Tax=Chanos chanos TaxID=29144 RepID=A0A6J2UTY5_CHACN|nr:putative P2Y purinoceptor 10 [Chanos chanos]